MSDGWELWAMNKVTGTKAQRRINVVFGLVAVLAIIVLGLVFLRPQLFGMGKEEISETQLGASFRSVAELSVEEYAYSNVGSFDQGGFEIIGRTVPFTGRNFLVSYEGSVKAGFKNADQVAVTIDDEARTLTVSMPKVEVTANSIDPGSIEVYDQSMNPLNQVRVDDVSGFLAEQEFRAAEKAVEQGLLTRAQQRAGELMRQHADALIEGTAMRDYAVEVRQAE